MATEQVRPSGRWALAFLLLTLVLTGCWDRRELEETAFVMALGIDRGQEQRYQVTAMLAVPREMLNVSTGEKEVVLITSVEAPTVSEGLQMMNGYIERQVSLLQAKVLVVGEEAARAGLLGEVLDPLQRVRELRRNLLVMVSRGEARDFLKGAKPQIERDPVRHIEMMTMLVTQTGMVPRYATVHHLSLGSEQQGLDPLLFLAALREESAGGKLQGEAAGGETGQTAEPGSPTDGPGGGNGPVQWLPGELPRRGGPTLDIIGAAVIRDGQMVDQVDGREMRLINLVRGHFLRGLISVPDPAAPDRRIPIEIRRGRMPNVRIRMDGQRPRIEALVTVEAILQGSPPGTDYTLPQWTARLEAQLAAALADETRALVDRARRDWQADPFGFGLRAARQFPSYPAWVAYNWADKWPQAEVTVNYSVQFRRFGTQMSPPHLKQGGE